MARQEDTQGARYCCSGCYASVGRAAIHVIPWYNETVENYVTTYRCDKCWQSSLDETEERFRQSCPDRAELERFAEFFRRHRITVLEFERQLQGYDAQPMDTIRGLGLALIKQVREGKLVLEP